MSKSYGNAAAFEKIMKEFDDETQSHEQISLEVFLATFEEPTTTIFDAKDFYPIASWSQSQDRHDRPRSPRSHDPTSPE